MKKINVLFTAAELTPIAKVGGLGDVAGSLPKALTKLGVNFSFFIPFHKKINPKGLKNLKLLTSIKIPFHKKQETVKVWTANFPNTSKKLYLFKHKYLSQDSVYKCPNLINPLTGKKAGNDSVPIKYIFFAKCAYEFIKQNKLNFDLVHVNDWHTVPLMLLLKADPLLKKIKCLLTVHNLPNKGTVSSKSFSLLGLPKKFKAFPSPKKKNIFFLKLGIIHADLINTVSQTYAKEILTKEFGAGLDPLLKKRKKNLYGVVNGLDLKLFNPKNDAYLKTNFGLKTLNKKKINKAFLQKKSGLKADNNVPVFGLVSRLFEQKGISLILKIINDLAKLDAQYIFTGTGTPAFENGFKRAQKKYPNKFYFLNDFDIPFGQQIYGGADIFLMPSLYEPCGLGQMIAMEYGAVPVVRATGGLKDTVTDNKTGFVFTKYEHQELLKTIKRAVAAYQDKNKWQKIVKAGMQADHSWDKSAVEYKKLYKKLIK